MKTLLTVLVAFIGLSLVAVDADARRFGGSKNLGMQRSAPAQKGAAGQPQQAQQPQQQQQAQQPQQAQQQGAPAQQPAGASKWLGPLAGFALGAGLAALFLNNGMAGLLAGLLVIGLIAAALFFVGRALLGRQPQRPLQYAGVPGSEPSPPLLPGGAAPHSIAATVGTSVGTSASAAPAGLDETEFLRHAKLNFIRLQEAHDGKDLSAMRDFLSPEVYRDIEADIQASWGAGQKTEVVALDAELVEVTREAGSYIVSVRFSGSIREAADREPERFSETWHLEKPASGRGGWVVAGIQQS